MGRGKARQLVRASGEMEGRRGKLLFEEEEEAAAAAAE